MPFGANNSSGFTSITYFVTGSTPGSYNLTATIKTANDEVPANDSVSIPVIVNPLVNVGVQDFTGPQYLMLGVISTINEPFLWFLCCCFHQGTILARTKAP